ncbi:hypothetical protein [Diaphorobacter caeni]|uniref:hypothetical protein n=1 Tax=Diaphorobacter caeni TaxID=2784387 RepID=UPI00188FFE4F|nr:hypothetical protein [Diaphorobacter caeni]MBF5007719.1 hypothetical protein [Diaphorobacter caeni]
MTTQNADGKPCAPSTTESDLIGHSADLLIFSRYLQRLPARVRVEVSDSDHGADVYAVCWTGSGEFHYAFARLIPDESGFRVGNDEIHAGIHEAFRHAAPASTYIGFRGCGRFPVAPLMQVAKLYERYGRGIFLDGNARPDPCAAMELKYGCRIASFRTNAPLQWRPHRTQQEETCQE